MPLSNTRELKEDVLFRAGESLTGSAWNTKVIDYLNRVYRTLASGAKTVRIHGQDVEVLVRSALRMDRIRLRSRPLHLWT